MIAMLSSNVGQRALALFVLLAALIACGGGGGSSGGSGGTLPASTMTPQSSPTTNAVQYSNAVSGVSGISGSASAYATGAVTIAAEATSPTGTALKRRATDNQTPIVYFGITANAGSATVTAFSATIVLSNAPAGTVSLSQWENGAWAGTGTTVTMSGDTLSFDYTLSPAATAPVYFALYTGTPLPAASPSPTTSPSSSPSSSPTSSPTASPSASPTASASPLAACAQTPNPSYQGGGVSDQVTAFFSALESAKNACVSVYEPSGQLMSAMETALGNGASLTVIFPAEEYTNDTSDATTLKNDGAKVVWLQDTQSPEYVISATPSGESIVQSYLPIHAKFALVDGVAYMDGHNWFESNPTDVILQDQNPADYTAIQTDLTTFPSAPPTVTGTGTGNVYVFTTDKGNSLTQEASVLNGAGVGPGYTVDFISESFDNYSKDGANGAQIYSALLAAASAGATVNVIVEGSVTNSYEACDLSVLAYNGAKTYVQTAGGSEKILLILNGSTVVDAWMGSSNASDYDYIDWGMTIPTGNTAVISALQTNYSTELGEAVASPSPAPAASPTCSP
ncbi:MAG TPA: hypothetical protein VMA98_02805 [Candidatus Acidoferrales bacterium]|nr:hypothetical protein [Candidatus Acidoferrales bacterium]